MLSAAIPVRVIAEEEQRQENTLEQVETGAADNSGGSFTSDIDTSEIGNESIKDESDFANPISHQAEPQVSLASDISPDPEQATKAAVSGYQHSDSATSGSVTLSVEWNDPVLGQPTTFHVSATGGSGSYLFRMDAPSYSNPNEYVYESVADPSRGEWTKYTDACASHDFTFTTTATGSYNFRFYLMDKASGVYYLRTNTYIQVADDAYPSVASIVNTAVSQAKQNTNGSDYEMALYLHDWLLDQLEYDNSLKWSSAESALTRGLGTCQAYESAYSKLLTAAGITNSETRDTYDGHTWNAVKLDGKWYQVDCTWDDTSDNFYGDLDQRHLYFCITDELMAIAHKGHAKLYTADGYVTRSTSLKDNYFVHNGKADEWTAKYADRIQQHLDANEIKFSIDADNQSFPPSISGIQNGIIAYSMGQREWKTNIAKVDLTAASNITMASNYEWTARFDFEVEYSKMPATPDISERTVEDGIYVIQCSFSPESVIDVQGGSWDPRANIQLWKSNGTMAQAFLFRYDEAAGAYEITNAKSEMALDVQGGLMSSGVNVQQYVPNSTEAQRWSVVPNEDGTFTLSPAGHPELALDASGGRSTSGTNIQVYATNGTEAQRWTLKKPGSESGINGIYVIQCSFSPESVIDVQGGSWDPRANIQANIQLWKSNGTMAQAFLFRYDEAAGAYEITNAKSEMALDVQGGLMSSGVNVQQYVPNSTEAQRWSVVPNEDGTFTLSPAGHPELALDASGGRSTSGTNIQVYATNGTEAQRWVLMKI